MRYHESAMGDFEAILILDSNSNQFINLPLYRAKGTVHGMVFLYFLVIMKQVLKNILQITGYNSSQAIQLTASKDNEIKEVVSTRVKVQKHCLYFLFLSSTVTTMTIGHWASTVTLACFTAHISMNRRAHSQCSRPWSNCSAINYYISSVTLLHFNQGHWHQLPRRPGLPSAAPRQGHPRPQQQQQQRQQQLRRPRHHQGHPLPGTADEGVQTSHHWDQGVPVKRYIRHSSFL